jgi:gamma-glutamylcyclotransferase (GGCT)/AIG2-like uncharacterized protein YtfP
MTLYFAYGSNMSVALMNRHCRDARALGTATLQGWRYIVTSDGYASIVPRAGNVVIGVLWNVSPRDRSALDAYEDLASGLYRRRVVRVRYGTRRLAAMVYIGRSVTAGRPKSGYQVIVIDAARYWQFPGKYLDELVRWSPRDR